MGTLFSESLRFSTDKMSLAKPKRNFIQSRIFSFHMNRKLCGSTLGSRIDCFTRNKNASKQPNTSTSKGGVFKNKFRPEAIAQGSSWDAADEMQPRRVNPVTSLVKNWTFNWSQITPQIVAGSCPRTTADVDRLMDECGVTGFVSLQSDLEVRALGLESTHLYHHIINRGGAPTRVPVHPTNEHNQAVQIPDAVRTLTGHLNAGRVTYIYGTAGLDRTIYALVSYFCFLQRMPLEDAMKLVGSKRPQARDTTDVLMTTHMKALDEDSRGAIAMKNYKQISYPWGRSGNMELWLKEFLQLLKDEKKFGGVREHPIARELEQM
mmetsp:Transcript_307/g.420  ORF Transcript_307/g.420 Transcript_307/m.420 type:complete len:321 (-) Transcript_307:105-1067(-)|eukprot:CAMPEP_0196580036 /NCGR_PEP_ID=MMETSP1081-20130531/26514_1 /TAXON_ID=36882 /ORGANISM="Pyramimonas amylifera, Strain CCMP720" /LENGTH=320 /DNA_ID=CAMNT_0041899795 /DNA_START=106 /DNA_END=1068 /DNA_ORIENTATION=+